MAMLVVLAISFFAAAVGFSVLGQGGGVLYTPLQVWAGIDFHTAAANSLFLVMTMSFSSSIVFRKEKRIDWPLAIVLEIATTLGGFLGGLYSSRLSAAALSTLFALIATIVANFMIKSFPGIKPPQEESLGVWRRSVGQQQYAVNLLIALPVSFLAGLLSGMLGVGGGFVKVPMMVILFGIPMEIAVGSSAFMVGVTAAGGFLGHLASGHWDWKSSLFLAVAVFAGGQIGSRLSVRIDKAKLQPYFGWFLLAVAVFMLLKGIW